MFPLQTCPYVTDAMLSATYANVMVDEAPAAGSWTVKVPETVLVEANVRIATAAFDWDES